MNQAIKEWQTEFDNLLPRIPTIRRLFSDTWLADETQKFQDSTRQDACHPLVALIINKGGKPEVFGCDANLLEDLFRCLESKIPSQKISEIKGKKYSTWHDFLSIFGELLIAYQLERYLPTVRIEPARIGTAKVPDLDWAVNDYEIGIEVNTVSETGEIRSDRADNQAERLDAITLSRLVTSYRESQRAGMANSSDVQARLSEVQEYDKIWDDPVPRVFGGVENIRPRFKSPGNTIGNLRSRKSDAAQLTTYKYKVLGLILPDEYFLRPYSFLRVFDIVSKSDPEIRSRTSGIVHKAFYGLRGEPIYSNNHVRPETGSATAVREDDIEDGRFISESIFDAAILCSISTSRGTITTPISFRFVLYEPYSHKNRKNLIPYWTSRELVRALAIDKQLSRRVCRLPWTQFLTSRLFLTLSRRLRRSRKFIR